MRTPAPQSTVRVKRKTAGLLPEKPPQAPPRRRRRRRRRQLGARAYLLPARPKRLATTPPSSGACTPAQVSHALAFHASSAQHANASWVGLSRPAPTCLHRSSATNSAANAEPPLPRACAATSSRKATSARACTCGGPIEADSAGAGSRLAPFPLSAVPAWRRSRLAPVPAWRRSRLAPVPA
jgi:hypothetical protein